MQQFWTKLIHKYQSSNGTTSFPIIAIEECPGAFQKGALLAWHLPVGLCRFSRCLDKFKIVLIGKIFKTRTLNNSVQKETGYRYKNDWIMCKHKNWNSKWLTQYNRRL